MVNLLKFQPIGSSWVALHPAPQGVIFFIGGAFYGTLPTLFYRYFLKHLYSAGYTIVALPFRFTFRHWAVARGLLQEQRQLRSGLVELAQRSGYNPEIYNQPENFFWIGHSLGCKYLALLELLSDPQDAEHLSELNAAELDAAELDAAVISPFGMCNQRSLLMAPDISDTENAVPRPLATVLNHLGWGVQPDRSQTLNRIRQSSLFNLTAIISFSQDTIAGRVTDQDETRSDVRWFLNHLAERPLLHVELPGQHLEPIGIQIGHWIVDGNPWDKGVQRLANRQLEATVLMLLEKLAQR
jgi:hypothetical protein